MTSPTRARWTPSGLTKTSDRSTIPPRNFDVQKESDFFSRSTF
jgi:hypothetical protein